MANAHTILSFAITCLALSGWQQFTFPHEWGLFYLLPGETIESDIFPPIEGRSNGQEFFLQKQTSFLFCYGMLFSSKLVVRSRPFFVCSTISSGGGIRIQPVLFLFRFNSHLSLSGRMHFPRCPAVDSLERFINAVRVRAHKIQLHNRSFSHLLYVFGELLKSIEVFDSCNLIAITPMLDLAEKKSIIKQQPHFINPLAEKIVGLSDSKPDQIINQCLSELAIFDTISYTGSIAEKYRH